MPEPAGDRPPIYSWHISHGFQAVITMKDGLYSSVEICFIQSAGGTDLRPLANALCDYLESQRLPAAAKLLRSR